MWAVYNKDSDVAVVQQILKAGVDPNARDDNGDTALVWALLRGNRAAARILEQAGASRDAQIRQAAQKALALLQKSSPQFVRKSGCISCHHQVLPTMAMAIAREHDIAFSESGAVQNVEGMIAVWKNAREHMTMHAHRIPNPPINVSYSLVGLGAAKYPKDETTEAMARFVTQHQQTDGSWRSQIRRPPMEASDITATALSLRAVQLYGNDAEGVSRAALWLAGQKPRSTEERAMQVLGLAWAQADHAVVDRRARELLASNSPAEAGLS
jgi:N-acyl-D-amino-acid deacylase